MLLNSLIISNTLSIFQKVPNEIMSHSLTHCGLVKKYRYIYIYRAGQKLAQLMACCLTAPSHYLSQYWPRSMLPYGVTKLKWDNIAWAKVNPYLYCHGVLLDHNELNKLYSEIDLPLVHCPAVVIIHLDHFNTGIITRYRICVVSPMFCLHKFHLCHYFVCNLMFHWTVVIMRIVRYLVSRQKSHII